MALCSVNYYPDFDQSGPALFLLHLQNTPYLIAQAPGNTAKNSMHNLVVSASRFNPSFFVELPFGQLLFALLLTFGWDTARGVTRGGKGRPQRRAGLMGTIEKG